MEFFILFVTGLSVGVVSAFFGIGGGAIMIPVLYSLFSTLPPASIISISLGAIVLNTALNNWRFYKKGLFPSRKSALIILGCSAAGAFAGSQILYLVEPATLKRIFGLVLLAMATRVAFNRDNKHNQEEYRERPLALGATCLIGSFVSSITGLGGGAIFVPFFLGLVKLPVNFVSPYSNVAMMAASFVGLAPHFFVPGTFELRSSYAEASFIGHVNLLFILCLFSGAFISSKYGVKLHMLAKPSTKKWLLTALLFLLALKILLGK